MTEKEAKIEQLETDELVRRAVDATHLALNMVPSYGYIEDLEQALANTPEFAKQAEAILAMPVFTRVVRMVMENHKDRLAEYSINRETDLLNRGAISGASEVIEVMKMVIAQDRLRNAKPEAAKHPHKAVE